jgi:polysaccharide biosynthesis protein PslG
VGVRRTSGRIAVVFVTLAAALVPAGAAGAKRQVPFGWMGVTVDGPMLEQNFAPFSDEFDQMAGNGVETARAGFIWQQAQPYRSFQDIPPSQLTRPWKSVNGVPTDFSRTDKLVRAALARGMRLLPVVVTAPDWARKHPGHSNSPPAGTLSYADYIGALVRRYGPNGEYWSSHPSLGRHPVRAWQVWNEPNNTPLFWDQPFAHDYVLLLRRA